MARIQLRKPLILIGRRTGQLKLMGILLAVASLVVGYLTLDSLNQAQPSPKTGRVLPVSGSVVDNRIEFQVDKEKDALQGEDYFVNYRLQREEFRQEMKAMLSQVLNSSVEKNKDAAQAKWLELANKIQQESEIENLLKIKGFQDAVADVNPDRVTVVIYAPALSPDQVRLVQHLVTGITGIRVNNIIISTKC